MSKTVYSVSSGWYSGYQVHFLFSERSMAERWIEMCKDKDRWLENPHVEEFTLDPDGAVETVTTGNPLWRVRFYPNGDVGTCIELEDGIGVYPTHARDGTWWSTSIVVRANDQEHAIKIASDQWAQLRARDEGIG